MKLFVLLSKIATKVQFWREIATQRAELSKLSDEMLKDIGISRLEALREASRPFWDTAAAKNGPYRGNPSAELRQIQH